MNSISRIQLPTPFDIGTVNCYALSGDSLSLIDPGPATDGAYEALRTGLTDKGYSISDITNILITHPHIDHFGGTKRIASESDVTVIAHENAVEQLSDPSGYFEKEQTFFDDFLELMGVPKKDRRTLLSLPEPYAEYGEPISPDRTVRDGDYLEVGGTLECLHTPGHAVGSVCFNRPDGEVVFTGDHVLPEVTPNPLLTISNETESGRTRSLPSYLSSLKKLTNLNDAVGYGGHGGEIQSVHERVDETITHHQERKESIGTLVSETAKTPYQLMKEYFPNLPMTEGFAGMSEIIGHIDLLDAENRLIWSESGGNRQCRLIN
jgi:glyoxylase-like metal-dependent hydrolase (beta-lactamase superfamily II)